jgi:hypothetical protein
MTERRTRWAMVVIGVAIWLAAIVTSATAWKEMVMPGIVLGAVMVSWAVFGLLTE